MSYTPQPNEFTVTNGPAVGWPTGQVAYLRIDQSIVIPNIEATLYGSLLDINGNILTNQFITNYSITGAGAAPFNAVTHSGIIQAGFLMGLTVQ